MYITHSTGSSVANSCLTFCDPVDCSPPGSSVHGIFQARTLEWILLQGNLPDPGIEPGPPALAGGFFTTEPPGKPKYCTLHRLKIGCSKIQSPSPSLSEGKYSWNKRTVLIKLAYLYVRHLIITYNNSFRWSFQFYWSQNSLEGIINLLKQ